MPDFRSILRETRDDFIADLRSVCPRAPITAQHINNGECADFATIVWERMGRIEAVEILDDTDFNGNEHYAHTFLRYQGRYYDAEAIEGVDTWDALPIFVRLRDDKAGPLDWGGHR